jgi:electron transport complex protein RnfG
MAKNDTKSQSKIEDLKPTIVLVAITLVITVLLSLTQAATSPVIAEQEQKTADAARAEVLAGATTFTAVTPDVPNIIDVYKEDAGNGWVVTAADKGFGGEIQVMVGFDANKNVLAVKVLSHTETPGLGTKAADPAYLKQYKGKSAEDAKIIKEGGSIDTITGATITSKAVNRAVITAIGCVDSL